MAYRRCNDCGQVYDLNADLDHECPIKGVLEDQPLVREVDIKSRREQKLFPEALIRMRSAEIETELVEKPSFNETDGRRAVFYGDRPDQPETPEWVEPELANGWKSKFIKSKFTNPEHPGKLLFTLLPPHRPRSKTGIAIGDDLVVGALWVYPDGQVRVEMPEPPKKEASITMEQRANSVEIAMDSEAT